MNKLRLMLADKIESNGGYSSGYHDRFAIEYPVGLYYADLDKDHIYKLMCEDQGYLPPITGLEWDENKIWEIVQEQMYYSLNDDDGNRTYSPATAKKYGLPMHRFPRKFKRKSTECAYCPAKKEGWILDEPFDCEYFDVRFELHGRSGKHLVVTEFEGHDLKMRSEDLAEQIRKHDSWRTSYSNKWCVKLLAMMEEWETIFSSKNASAEMEYQAAFLMYQDQEERVEAWRKALKKARARHVGVRFLTQWSNPQLPGFEARA